MRVGALALLLVWTCGLPFGWTHDLGPSCIWKRAPWAARTFAGSLGSGRADRARVARCLAARGGNDPEGEIPTVKVLLARWPSAAEVAAWRNPDAPALRPQP